MDVKKSHFWTAVLFIFFIGSIIGALVIAYIDGWNHAKQTIQNHSIKK